LESLEDRCLLSSYSITDIGVVGSDYQVGDLPGNGEHGIHNAAVLGINNASVVQIVGTNGNWTKGHAFLWDAIHGMQDLGTAGSDNLSAAYGINLAGQVTGISESVASNVPRHGVVPKITSEHGFVWTSAQGMKSMGSSTYPTGINGSGELSGRKSDQAAVLIGSNWTQLGILQGGTYSVGRGINDYGQVVGYGDIPVTNGFYHAFLWTPSSPNGAKGTMIDLGTIDNTAFGASSASAVNSLGWVTGTTSDLHTAADADHAFVWKPSSANGTTGAMIDLGTLGVTSITSVSESEGVAINRSGVVVGDASPLAGTYPTQTTVAVVWQPGTGGSYTVSDLNTLIPSGTGWTLTRADAINDNGQIVVETAQGHALLLTPITTSTALAQLPASTLTTTTGGLAAPSGKQGAASSKSSISNSALSGPSSTLFPGALALISNPDPLPTAQPGFGGANVAAEPYVAVNPTNPQNIVAAWMDHPFVANVASVTLDGGKTWQNVPIPVSQCEGGPFSSAGDPWVSFDPNGDLYVSSVVSGGVTVNKSTDGGLTWSQPIQLVSDADNGRTEDKPSITADPTNPKYVYATWARINKPLGNANNVATMFARSADGGKTWEPDRDIHDAPNNEFDWGHQIVVLPDGTLINAFCEGDFNGNRQAALTLLRSSDHGQTWSAPITAVVQEPLVDPNAIPPNALVTDPNTGQLIDTHPMFDSIVVDRTSGNLYAVWIDARFSNFHHNSIAFSMSSDGGLTWSSPIQVNQTPTNIPSIEQQAWNPTVAVSANGTVAVTYYDFRNNTGMGGALTDYWMAFAPAPGTNPSSWSEIRLTNTSFNLEQAPSRTSIGFKSNYFLGDYEGLAAAGKAFVAVWGMPDGSATGQESIFFRDPPPAETDTSPPSVPKGSLAAIATSGFNISFDFGIPVLSPPASPMFNRPDNPPGADSRLVSLALSPDLTSLDQVFANSPWNTDGLGFPPSRRSQEGFAVDLLAAGLVDSLLQDVELPR
jgi:probable HAF family extracellular repeat protein